MINTGNLLCVKLIDTHATKTHPHIRHVALFRNTATRGNVKAIIAIVEGLVRDAHPRELPNGRDDTFVRAGS